MDILYEDNHFIAVNKKCGEIVQGDKSGDPPLCDIIKSFIKKRDAKPGNVYLGIPHRLDRPVSGVSLFCKTSKSLSRMNDIFRQRESQKIYWAVCENPPPEERGRLNHYLVRDRRKNKSFVSHKEHKGSKQAVLDYYFACESERYFLLIIKLMTGRHHQIRCQLAKIGCPVKGDLKYGARRSNSDGGISLHARELSFIHPVKNNQIKITAPLPDDSLWHHLDQKMKSSRFSCDIFKIDREGFNE